jgi:hypothetical protein
MKQDELFKSCEEIETDRSGTPSAIPEGSRKESQSDPMGTPTITPAREWEWHDNEHVVIQGQSAIALYLNPRDVVVIRQERDWCDEDDPFICVRPENLPRLIDKLRKYLPG